MRNFEVEYIWLEGTATPKQQRTGTRPNPRYKGVIEQKSFKIEAEDWDQAKVKADKLLESVEQRFLAVSPQLKRAKNWKLVPDRNPKRYWSDILATKLDDQPVEYCKRHYGDSRDCYEARIISY